MITIKDYMETISYKITEGSDYTWDCYGPDAYRLDSWNGEQDGNTVSIVFDTADHTVYEVSAYDYSRNRAYRLINPDYKQAHDEEALDRDVNPKQAWDDVNYIDLETDDDFIQKALAIIADEDYDDRVSVPLVLPDDALFDLMKLAHEKDMTLNQLVEEALKIAIEEHKLREELDGIWPDAEPIIKEKKSKKGKK